MTAVSTTFTLSVVEPSNTVLAKIAQATLAGQYSFQSATVTDRFLGESHPDRPADATDINEKINSWGGGSDGLGTFAYQTNNTSSRQILLGAGGAGPSYWDTSRQEWWHSAGVTASWDSSQCLVRYDVSRDEFRHWHGPVQPPSSAVDPAALWPGFGRAHNFSCTAYDPDNHRMYALLGPQAGRGTDYSVCWANTSGANTDTSSRGWLGTYANTKYFTQWPTTRFVPNLGGPLGTLIVFPAVGATAWRPCQFDLNTGTWTDWSYTVVTNTPFAGSSSDWSRRFPVTVYDGGYIYAGSMEDGQNQFWRFAVDGSGYDTDLAPCPVPMDGSGWDSGIHTEFAVMNGYIYAVHPNQAYPTVAQDGGIWRYNIATDQWSSKLAECFNTLLPLSGTPITADPHNFTVAAVPELNSLLIAFQTENTFTTKAFLWKAPS